MLDCRASLGPASQLPPCTGCSVRSPAGPFLPPVLLAERCGAQRVPGPPPQLAFVPLPRSGAGWQRLPRTQHSLCQPGSWGRKAVCLSTWRRSLRRTAILLPDPARSGAVCAAHPHLVWHRSAPSPGRHPQGPSTLTLPGLCQKAAAMQKSTGGWAGSDAARTPRSRCKNPRSKAADPGAATSYAPGADGEVLSDQVTSHANSISGDGRENMTKVIPELDRRFAPIAPSRKAPQNYTPCQWHNTRLAPRCCQSAQLGRADRKQEARTGPPLPRVALNLAA